jgi:hypothetical protein
LPAWALIAIVVGSLVASVALMTVLAVELPADYFSRRRRPPTGPWWRRVGLRVAKNVAGGLLVLVGIVLSLPGIPGPGLLTILVGLMLTDLPGVRWLARTLVRRKSVRSPMNSLRKKFGKAPLRVE